MVPSLSSKITYPVKFIFRNRDGNLLKIKGVIVFEGAEFYTRFFFALEELERRVSGKYTPSTPGFMCAKCGMGGLETHQPVQLCNCPILPSCPAKRKKRQQAEATLTSVVRWRSHASCSCHRLPGCFGGAIFLGII